MTINAARRAAGLPELPPEPQLDPVILAHEADQAWAAYEYALRNLAWTQTRLEMRERNTFKDQALLAAFERIASHVYAWMLGSKDAGEVMEAIKADVDRGRRDAEARCDKVVL